MEKSPIMMSAISRTDDKPHDASEIIPNVYQLTIRSTNVVLIVDEELTLIDTGLQGSSAGIVDFIRQLGRSPEEISLIVLTHNHVDHVGGLAELKHSTPARTTIHANDIGERGNRPAARAEDIDIRLEGGEVLKPMGGLRVIHTPGHTPGSICLFSPRTRLLIAGDAVRNGRKALHLPARMAGSDMRQAAESIEKMAELDFSTLCLGHGLPLTEDVQVKMQGLIERIKD